MLCPEVVGLFRTPKIVAVVVVAVTCLCSSLIVSQHAYAQVAPKFLVRVVIELVRALDGFEGFLGGDADFYSVVTIDGQRFPRQGPIGNRNVISPNWRFEKMVDRVTGSVPVVIQIWDDDGGLRFGDDQADITANRGSDLDLEVELLPCRVSGDITGDCGITLSSRGGGSPRADISFRVEVIEISEPPSTVGLIVRCTHAPLWPRGNQVVTITAESLDGALNPRQADRIEVWRQPTTPSQTFTNAQTGSFTVSSNVGTVAYGCRVIEDGSVVFSGWRLITVGAPAQGRAVPVLLNRARKNSIDILLVPDNTSYTGPQDPNFLTAAAALIRNGYYGEPVFLTQQRRINFWLGQDTAVANGFPPPAGQPCNQPPANFNTEYLFAEAVGILHTRALRDCAPGRLFSSRGNAPRVVLHETGHAAFGLADEYCCDGGYFESLQPNSTVPLFPNVYDSKINLPMMIPHVQNALNRCRADSPDPANCRTILTRFIGLPGEESFATSDPQPTPGSGPVDLMNDNGPARVLDLRRINWKFGECGMVPPRC